MCGIVGILSKDHSSRLETKISGMVNALPHRGPDDSAFNITLNGKLAFGHTRLSIQDLSAAGRQPLIHEKTGSMLIFNGEIYNFKSLKKDLSKKHKISYKSNSDTEVLLNMLMELGVDDSLKAINGMFAFAFYHKPSDKLYLVRDRLGEKPLYYGLVAGNFVFSSELKAINSSSQNTVNFNIVGSYLKFGYIPSPYTIYNNIYKLAPGKLIEIDLMQESCFQAKELPETDTYICQQKTYWSLEATYKNRTMLQDPVEIVESLNQILLKSTKDKLVSDVPIGAFLSGGIDSSLVSALMQSVSSSSIKTFTIGFSDKEFNEAPFAKEVSDHLGTEHYEAILEPNDILELIPKIPHFFDEPFADPSCLPSYLVSKLAREQVTVSLSGDGGDELFGGYNRYIWTKKVFDYQQKIPLFFRKKLSSLLSSISATKLDSAYNILNPSSRRTASVSLKIHKLARLLSKNDAKEIYNDLLAFCPTPEKILAIDTQPGHTPGILDTTDSFYDYAMLYDQLMYLPEDNLTKVDRTSMTQSLETRLPLLDHRVVEFSWNIPNEFKIYQGTSKWVLRQVLYKYVPQKIIDRPKMGFSIPIRDWLKGPLLVWTEDLLSPDMLKKNDVFNPKEVQQIWQQHKTGKYDNSLALWAILMYQAWQDEIFS